MSLSNILVFGIGGVGGFFAGKIATMIQKKSLSHTISCIARGAHLNAVIENGLTLKTPDQTFLVKPLVCTDNVSLAPSPDFVFLCVKSYDLENACLELKKVIHSNTIILPLLNGVDIYDRIKKILSDALVLPSCIYIGTHIESPGVVAQKGGEGRILTGNDPLKPNFDYTLIHDFFKNTELKYQWFDLPTIPIWEKYLFIASFGLVTAAYQKTFGELFQSIELKQTVEEIMKEIYQLALSQNIKLSENIVNETMNKALNFPPETKTSFQRDFEQRKDGKPNEADLFGTTIIRLGKQFNIKTPSTEKVFSIILNQLKG